MITDLLVITLTLKSCLFLFHFYLLQKHGIRNFQADCADCHLELIVIFFQVMVVYNFFNLPTKKTLNLLAGREGYGFVQD